MKKFLLSLATVLCAGAFANATEVSVDIAAINFNEVTVNTVANYTSDGFTFTLNKNQSVTPNRLTDNNHIRLYQKATFTITGNEGQQITKIVLSCISGKSNNGLTVDETTYTWSTDNTLTWEGDATEVVFYNPNSVVQISKATITYVSEGEVVVAAPVFSIGGGKFGEAQTVELTAADGCTIYYTTDGVDPTDDVNDGSTIKYNESITVDKTMTIKAIAYDADDNKSGIVSETYTIVELLEGAEGDGTIDNPYNAVAAYNEALLGSTAEIYVKGIVASIYEISTQYGNASYYISADGTETNQFYIFRGYNLGGEKFTSEDQLNVGDNVVVKGKLTTYNEVPQLASGNEIVELNGEGPEPIVLEGEGTEANPFTVADVIAINPTSTTSNEDYPDEYWISGYIVGRCDGTAFTPVFSAEAGESSTVSASNIVLAPSADCTDAALCIPVQLPSGPIREALNLADNPTVLGQEVAVYGKILKYFSNPGVKNTSDYKLGSDGIEGVEIEENNAPVEYFNLQGVRVANPENGLYIMRQGDKVTKVIK